MPIVIVMLYVPAWAVVMLGIEGFITLEVHPLGPVQLYEAPGIGLVTERLSVCPAHKGPLLVIGGAIIPQFVVPVPPV